MKKILSVFVMLLVCASMLCISISTASGSELTDVPKVVALKVSYYSKASATEANFAGYLYGGTEIAATEYNSSFSVFNYNGEEYYILNTRLNDVVRYVVSETAQMKESADEASATLAQLYWSTPLTLLGFEKDGYYFCEYNGTRGYVEASAVGYVVKMKTAISSSLYSYAAADADVLTRYTPVKEVVVQYKGDNWARVEYDGYMGYTFVSNLKYPVYKLNGKIYSTPENLQKSVSAATVSEQVSLMAVNKETDSAMIQNSAGEIYWTKASSLTSTKTYTQKYVCNSTETLYKEASVDSESFMIRYMEKVMVGETITESSSGSWVEVKYNDDIYYVWIAAGEVPFTDTESKYTYVGDTIYAQEVLDLAKEIALEWETVYTFAESEGNPDKNGRRQFDCSGFVSYVLDTVMKKYNPVYDISSGLATMYYETDSVYNAGYNGEFKVQDIEPENMRPGDILFFDADDNGIVDHCAIYLGNNEFAHSVKSFETGVMIALMDKARADTLVSVRRFTPEKVTEANKIRCTVEYGKLYAEKDLASAVLYEFGKNEKLTVHFTNSDNWAYVTINGKKGFMLIKNIGDFIFPDAPEISIKLSDGRPKISWGAVDKATKYSIYRSESLNGTYKCIKTLEDLSYTDLYSGLEYGKNYYYKVKARNDNGYSVYSNCVTIAPLDKPVISVTLSGFDPKISWNTVDGATKYNVYRSTALSGTYKLIKTTTSLSYTDTSSALIDGKIYYYRVKAVNSNGSSAYSLAAKKLLLTKPVVSASLSDGYAKISWKAVPGATKYWVYRSTAENGAYKCIATVTGTSCTDKSAGLVKGTAYYYKIKAVSDSGNTDFSNCVKAVPLGRPSASAVLTSSNNPKISWKAVDGATKYSIYRSATLDGTYRLIKTTTALSYTDTSSALTDGNMYYYKVKARNADGLSKSSSIAKILLLSKPVVSASLSDGYAKISWNAVSGATKYWVYRSTAEKGTYKCIATVTGISCTDKSSSLVKGTKYYYKVKAVSNGGNTDFSNCVKMAPLARPAVSVVLTSAVNPKISWKAVDGATKYSIYRSATIDGTYKLIKTTTALSYTDTSSALTDGNMYYYKVKARNADGFSASSSIAKILILNKAVISSSLSDGRPKISWKAVPGATKYSVYRAESKSGEYKCIITVTALSYVDKSTALEKGKTYYYKVRARSDSGYADYSGYTAVAPLGKPTVTSSLSNGNPKISWKAVTGATKYSIYRSDSLNGTYKLIKTTEGLSYTDTSSALVNGKAYYYKVKAVSAKGYSASGNVVYKKVAR
ncbi:MAG: C40 family peptidase [Clostridia bacterium]|nr:C40 family peptidase [Clostridia bacterium]